VTTCFASIFNSANVFVVANAETEAPLLLGEKQNSKAQARSALKQILSQLPNSQTRVRVNVSESFSQLH